MNLDSTMDKTEAESATKARRSDVEAIVARWFLGGLFIYMGLSKAMHPVEFLKLVRQYEMVGSPFALNTIAALLPWFEIVCGALLVAGIAVRGTALMMLGMLIPFTLIVLRRALALAAERSLPFCAIKFDCGCGTGEVVICSKLLQNSGLIILAGWLLASRARKLCLRFGLFG